MKAIVALCLILAIAGTFALEDASAAKKNEKRGLGYGGYGHFGGYHSGGHDFGYHGGFSHSYGPYHYGHSYYPHGYGHHPYYY